jgi:hypothetical protein
MNKKLLYTAALAICLNLTGCEDYLTKAPLDSPSTGQFFNNETEINGALTAVYKSVLWGTGTTPYQSMMDNWTDIALLRAVEIGEGNIDVYNAHAKQLWVYAYTTIQRANTLLDGMVAGKNKVSAEKYAAMEAEARVLRAYAYSYLISFYGDVPLITKPLEPADYYTQTRTPKAQVLQYIYSELDAATAGLGWKPGVRGRVSKSMALGLKARIALYNKDFATAAAASKQVIDNAGLGLYPNFGDLFTKEGQAPNTNGEIMFELLYSDADANAITYLPLGSISRTAGGQSGRFPQQRLVDMFEAADGKRIDESKVYDHAHPSRNRDKRLKYTVGIPGDTLFMNQVHFVYDIYGKTTSVQSANGTWTEKTNADYDNAYGPSKSGVGLLHTKYMLTNENAFSARVAFILMRYPEILLTYAEAKIEQGQVDDSVVAAINLLRKRAGLPNVEDAVKGDQNKMRQLIRRERNAELAMEGFRWFDVRRWGIASLVMPQKVMGISKVQTKLAAMPNFKASPASDLNSIPNYDASEGDRMVREQRYWFEKLELLPVPQSERDLVPNLSQNPGWE